MLEYDAVTVVTQGEAIKALALDVVRSFVKEYKRRGDMFLLKSDFNDFSFWCDVAGVDANLLISLIDKICGRMKDAKEKKTE